MTQQEIAEITTVTPNQAERWLSSNTSNRRIDTARVDMLARDMMRGKWKFNGDAIRFAKDGTLLDGQHRLTACVMADKPFQTLVIRGLDAETQKTMDLGKARTLGDVLTIGGETNGTYLSTVVRMCYVAEQLGLEAAVLNRFRPT